MTKFISISDGNEIKIGDEITIVSIFKNSVGGITKVYKNIIATRQVLQKLFCPCLLRTNQQIMFCYF